MPGSREAWISTSGPGIDAGALGSNPLEMSDFNVLTMNGS
jgi:hypothetical protein